MSKGVIEENGASKVLAGVKRKRSEPSTKNHRFQSFSSRVATITIKPFRTNGAERKLHANVDDQESHFKVCLDKWRDQNMSNNFTAFSEDVDPYSQSLTQVVHHRADIVALLIQYIEKRDVHSLEPLFQLFVRLADDLWLRFEEFFERCIGVVASTAATHTEVEAVEWSFDAITGLFKRFARVLKRDLIPLYSLMAPLLGKVRQKAHVSRFSAEAMSFLVRRTTLVDGIDTPPLRNLIQHALSDLAETPESQRAQYQLGIMTMLADAMKNTQYRVRENSASIVTALLDYALALESTDDKLQLTTARDVLEGVLTNVIHHTNVETFEPVLNEVLAFCRARCESQSCSSSMDVIAHTLYVMVGVRRGSRISRTGWTYVLQILKALVDSQVDDLTGCSESAESIVSALAVVFQYAPFDLLPGHANGLLETMETGSFKNLFLKFCVFMDELGHDRLVSLVASRMRDFISKNWGNDQAMALMVLPRLASDVVGSFANDLAAKDLLSRVQHLHDILLSNKNIAELSWLYETDAQLDLVLKRSQSRESGSCAPDLFSALQRIIDNLIQHSTSHTGSDAMHLALGRGLQCMLSYASESELRRLDIGPFILMSSLHASSLGYLEAILTLTRNQELVRSVDEDSLAALFSHIVPNLSGPNQHLRKSTLTLLAQILEGKHHHELAQPIQHALEIEGMAIDPRNIRAISQMVRKLGQFDIKTSPPWHRRAMASICLGLLHIKLTPIWEDVLNVLGEYCHEKDAEDLVVELMEHWLRKDSTTDASNAQQALHADAAPVYRDNHFQCTNLLYVDQASDRSAQIVHKAPQELRARFENHNLPQSLGSLEHRAKALMIIKRLSVMTEKRSRLFVPLLLEWMADVQDADTGDLQLDSDDETIPSPVPALSNPVSRDDKRALLEVFASFENSKALYRSEEVREVLLSVLCSGDASLQKPAVRALFKWRDPSLTPYEDNIMNLLDDSRFRDELTTFVHVDDEESVIQPEHRPQIMPVLLRILYGRAIARTGTKDRGGLVVRRKAVLNSLARLGDKALQDFVAIAIDPLQFNHVVLKTMPPSLDEHQLTRQPPTWKKQIGLLRMVQDLASSLSDMLEPSANTLMESVVFCLVLANRRLDKIASQDPFENIRDANAAKNVRQDGTRALGLLFETCPGHDWTSYTSIIMRDILAPRLKDLVAENAQAVSSLFRLFSSWAQSSATIGLLLDPKYCILQRLADSLNEDVLKDAVRLFLLGEVFTKTLQLASPDSMSDVNDSETLNALRVTLREGMAATLLLRVEQLLSIDPSKDILEAGMTIVEQLQPYISNGDAPKSFVRVVTVLLNPDRKHMNHTTRARLLRTLETYLPGCQITTEDDTFVATYDTLSSLFNYFLDVPNRQLLVRVFKQLTQHDHSMSRIATLCEALNARSASRLGEADADALDEAFATVFTSQPGELSSRQWQPLIQNFLYLIKDDADLSPVRGGAASCLRKFSASLQEDQPSGASRFGSLSNKELADQALLPAIRTGIRESSETVRGEHLMLLEELAKNQAPGCSDMRVLLEDENRPSFFSSVLAMQHTMRLNAWRKLASEAHNLSAKNIANIFVPLVETTVAQVSEKNQNLVNEAVTTLDMLVESLSWSQYRFLLQRMVSENKRFDSKLSIRVLAAVVNAFHRAWLRKRDASATLSRLSESLPGEAGITNALGKGILPTVMEFLHFKDESTVDLRTPVAIIATKMVIAFPEEEMAMQIPHLVLEVSNILKSKAQEARDAARRTLSEIAVLIGADHFSFILRTLKSTLARGAHLHILSFTLQHLLRTLAPSLDPGDLDYCLQDLLGVAINDIFGVIREEKDAADYKSRKREVRSGNSYEILEIVASVTIPEKFERVLNPLRERLNKPKPPLEKIRSALQSINKGIKRNTSFKTPTALAVAKQLAQSDSTTNPLLRHWLTTLCASLIDAGDPSIARPHASDFLTLIHTLYTTEDEEAFLAGLTLTKKTIDTHADVLSQNAPQILADLLRVLTLSTDTATKHAALDTTNHYLSTTDNAQTSAREFRNFCRRMVDEVFKFLSGGAEQRMWKAACRFVVVVKPFGVEVGETEKGWELMVKMRDYAAETGAGFAQMTVKTWFEGLTAREMKRALR